MHAARSFRIPRVIRGGEIEHTYFECPDCGEAYRFSTTDKVLRKRIEEYTKMAARLKKGNCTEQFHRRVQKLKETNVQRSRELGRAYPLASLLMKEYRGKEALKICVVN